MRKNTDNAVLARKATIARLHLQGYSGQEIAPKVGVSESQVSRDLKAITEVWRETALQDITERKSLDLAELTLVKRELWSAWHSSPKKKKDPRFMGEVMKALKQSAELLGYNHTTKVSIDYSNLSDSDLNYLIEEIIISHEKNTIGPES